MSKFVHLRRFLNFLTIKHNNYIYVAPHHNAFIDNYSLDNANSDNVLAYVNYLKQGNEPDLNLRIYIETTTPDMERFSNGNIEIIPLYINDNAGKVQKIKSKLKRMTTKYHCNQWWRDNPTIEFEDHVKSQKVVCFNYGTESKNSYAKRSSHLWDNYTHVFSTSILDARVQVSNFGGSLDKFYICGYSRNDCLLKNERENVIRNWLKSIGIELKDAKFIVYAPTVNEEPSLFEKYFFGFDDKGELEKFLEEQNIYILYKPHPLERYKGEFKTNRVIEYPRSKEFSLYDLLSFSDALITNYSSVVYDYLITGKPVIYNYANLEEYMNIRGLAYEPPYAMLVDEPATNWEEMKERFKSIFKQPVSKKYFDVQRILNKYVDSNSSKRITEILFNDKEAQKYKVKEWLF